MPIGKPRGGKRSSSTSYASTVTTVIFVALCVLGVWMLSSNSLVPPQTTTKAATGTIDIDTEADTTSSDTNDEPKPTKPDTTDLSSSTNDDYRSKIGTSESKKDQPVFEDNPGRLPDDAIKSDEPHKSQMGAHNDGNKESKEVSATEENVQGLQGTEHAEEKEKQRQGETQLSEESTMTQSQEAERTVRKSNDENTEKQEDKKSETEKEDSHGDSQDQKQNANPMEETNKEAQKQMMKEYEKEQREQREEDAGDQKISKKTGNDNQKVIQQDQQQKHEQEQEQEQKQDSNTEVTFSDSTREEQPTEQGFSKEATQNNIPQNSTNEETGQQQQEQEQEQQQQQNEEQKPEDSEHSKEGSSQEEQKREESSTESNSGESFPGVGNSGIPKESAESKKSWKTQATESKNEKKRQKDESDGKESVNGYMWKLCNSSAGPDYIPCLDNEEAIMKLKSRRHFEHRERHCPEVAPMCLVPLPDGYKEPIKWPKSRDKIWYHNVPHTKLAEVKGHQNWVKVTGEFLTFPGGGTQFIHGALHYIDFLQQSVPNIRWGEHSRVVLDIGCGVASFGGYLFERDVLTMSLAPKDEHEAQVQFALERGIPAISAVMGTQRLQFPSRVFDIVHCARCRVPWHNEGGLLLLELNRVLRPGGYFVWSATPVYQKLQEDVEIWNAMSSLTKSMCWELVTIKKDKLNGVGAAIYRKPVSNECYEKRQQNQPPMCKNDDDANAAWYVPLQACMHKVPVNPVERGSKWPENWPRRLQAAPYWLNISQMGIYGKPAPQDFTTDNKHWKKQVSKVYMNELGISWSDVRKVMDMRAVYGGFAAALKDLEVWVMNVVNVDSPDTLPIIYERGLFGIYHDWCESFSTYPRSYDLLHADHLFSKLKDRCKVGPVMAEVDRIVRPGGKLIVRDESNVIREVENLLKSLHWDVHLTFSKNHEGILSAQKGNWRPNATEASP